MERRSLELELKWKSATVYFSLSAIYYYHHYDGYYFGRPLLSLFASLATTFHFYPPVDLQTLAHRAAPKHRI